MISTIREQVVASNQLLGQIVTAGSLASYLRPAFKWNPPKDVFPFTSGLRSLLVETASRLYGDAVVPMVSEHLSTNWAFETGAHVHLPRRHDRVNKREGVQLNPLIFQGQTVWAACAQEHGYALSLSLSSSRVPSNNANSGRYIDFSESCEPYVLVSDKWRPTPQMLISRIPHEVFARAKTLRPDGTITESELRFLHEVIGYITDASGSFSDQIAAGHSWMVNQVLPATVKQITLDGDRIGTEFIAMLIGDRTSLLHQVFNDEQLRSDFLTILSGIETGWKEGESPFHGVDHTRATPKLIEYHGQLDPRILGLKLHHLEIIPTGVLKYATLMLEAGMCPVGGMFQSAYCTQIKERLVAFLESVGESGRASALAQIPTHLAVITPCWGLRETDGGLDLLHAFYCRQDPLTQDDLRMIAECRGEDALMLALPVLAKLLLGHEGLTYDQIVKCVQTDKIIVRK